MHADVLKCGNIIEYQLLHILGPTDPSSGSTQLYARVDGTVGPATCESWCFTILF